MIQVYSKVIQLRVCVCVYIYIYIYIYIFFFRFFSIIGYRLLQYSEYSSLCYTVGPYLLSILYIIVCTC